MKINFGLMILALLIQIANLVGDIALIAASAYVTVYQPLFGLILSLITYRVWSSQGGWEAWNPRQIKQFFINFGCFSGPA